MRIEIYRKLPDLVAAKEQLAKAIELQIQIWRQAVVASRSKDAPPSAPILLLPALNAMIDITMTQVMAAQMHPPIVIFAMLFGLALAASLLAGYAWPAASYAGGSIWLVLRSSWHWLSPSYWISSTHAWV
jgi:hypothetical protein